MKPLVIVVVYDRKQTISAWMRAWKYCEKIGPLAIIHNHPDPIPEITADFYIHRDNSGADIGAFQEAIQTFKEYDTLFWFCDDLIPMRPDFLLPAMAKLENADLVGYCFEPANQNNHHPHIRTVAFAIKRELAEKLVFPDKLDQQGRYAFESSANNMYLQTLKLGYKADLVFSGIEKDYVHWTQFSDWIWDSHALKHLDLYELHQRRFPPTHDL
jgi:hypothetical protein